MTDLGYSNIMSITQFEDELYQYEIAVNANSRRLADYHYPSTLMKKALDHLLNTQDADVYSMMRRLASRVLGQKDGAYSEYSLTMLASATLDERCKTLIMNIVYVTREIVTGKSFGFGDSWFNLIDNNVIIKTFLKNYTVNGSGIIGQNNLTQVKPLEKIASSTKAFMSSVGLANYQIKLSNSEIQTFSVQLNANTYPSESLIPNVLSTNVVIVPAIGKFNISKSVVFTDDAIAQAEALNCIPQGYTSGSDTLIQLPDVFYALSLTIVSINKGTAWKVVEVNVLPPLASRFL